MLVRALLVLCLVAGTAAADDLPTIDDAFPPALRVGFAPWGVAVERIEVAIRSAPEVTFVVIELAGRERTVQLPLDVPAGTKIVGLGTDGVDGRAWGRPMPIDHARDRRSRSGGALLALTSTSAGEDHLTLDVRAPATVELALHLPPLVRLAIEAPASVLAASVDGERAGGKQRRIVVELADVAGTTGELGMAHATERIALVAAPAAPTEFLEHAPRGHHGIVMRDLDKAMIRRRMKWFRPHWRQCFMRAAQTSGLRRGGAIVSFLITADGTIAWATTTESDLPAAVTDCLVEQVRRLEFPAADGNVLVNYPFEFTTEPRG